MASTPTNESEAVSFFQSRGAWMADPTMIMADRRPISDHDAEHLALLRQIELLTLGETAITDAAMPVICGLHNLTLLDISGTRITDKGAAHLAALTKLQCLGVAGTSIGDATTAILLSLARIDMLNVNWTRITDTGLMNL